VCGPRGPRGPLTAIVDHVPVLEPGRRVALDTRRARIWHTPEPPAAAAADRVLAACAAVRPHAWNDPRALALGSGPLADGVRALTGRGPGLTPAGDDVLAGFVLARRAFDVVDSRRDVAIVLACGRQTGEPARSLLRAAADGEAFEPAAAMLAALLAGDGAALAPAVRRLAALGATTGRAMLTGLIRGLTTGLADPGAPAKPGASPLNPS
jgi:hypothetical protein